MLGGPLATVAAQRRGKLGGGGVKRGISSPPFKSSTTLASKVVNILRGGLREKECLGGADSAPAGQGCCRAGTLGSGLLLQDVSGVEVLRKLEAYYRSKGFQQVREDLQLSDGDRSVGSVGDTKERLDGLYRPQGCVPASTRP